MKRNVLYISMIVLGAALVGVLIYIGLTVFPYIQSADIYEKARGSYLTEGTGGLTDEEIKYGIPVAGGGNNAGANEAGAEGGSGADASGEGAEPAREPVLAPVQVDFDKILAENPDTVAWIYCPDTVLNYPVVWRTDTNYYMDHAYDGTETRAGAIFEDGHNYRGFDDLNVIIYGHNMKDGKMFASLSDWADQSFYEAHPVMWILTPEQDYRLELFSAYICTATDQTVFRIFDTPDESFRAYLDERKEKSLFTSDVEIPEDAHYITFSTCEYSISMGRFIIHGKLVPVDSAGGKQISQ